MECGYGVGDGFPRVVDYLKISADAYYNRVKDKIVAVPAMFVWKMSNVGKVETTVWMSAPLRK